MPITISGDGGIAGVTNLDGGDFECATLVASGDTTLGPQAVGRASLFVDDSANSVGINTTTPAVSTNLGKFSCCLGITIYGIDIIKRTVRFRLF